jgi:hypothetical protein
VSDHLRDTGQPFWWPYQDLKLCTPHCPLCGSRAAMMVGANLHPMAFCPDEDCSAFSWDPSIPAAQLLAAANALVRHETA